MKPQLPIKSLLLVCLLTFSSLVTYAQNTTAGNISKPILELNPGPYDTICAGTNVIFTAISVGEGNHPVYNWKKNGKLIKGTIGDTYACDNLHDGDIISCTLTKSLSSTNAVSVTAATHITVHNIPAVAIVNSNSPLCEGDTMRLTACSVNEGATYQWTGPDNFKASGNNPLATAVSPNEEGYYTVRALLNGCPSAPDSTYVIVNTKVSPQVTLIPAPSNTVCSGTPITFTASTEYGGNEPGYQWLKNNTPIPGATNNSYLEMNTIDGDSITLLFTSNAICPTSKTISTTMPIIVNPFFTPAVSINSNSGNTITQGNALTLTANTAYSRYASYQWKRNGFNIPGANTKTYTTDDVSDKDIYSVSITTNAQCALSTTANSNKITMHVLPQIVTAEEGIAASPNPNTGSFVVKGLLTDAKEASIDVLSVIGQCVYKGTVALQNGSFSKQLSLDVPNGVYVVRGKAGDKSFTQRIMIQR